MLITSAKAAKMLRQLNDELRTLQVREGKTKTFVAALQEDIESVRPKYNFKEMRDAQAEVERKIRKLKHALNVFNTTTVVPEFDMTIDEMLVLLPQLNKQCSLLKLLVHRRTSEGNNAFRLGSKGHFKSLSFFGKLSWDSERKMIDAIPLIITNMGDR